MKALFIKGSRAGLEVDATPKRVAYWKRVGLVNESTEVSEEDNSEEHTTDVTATQAISLIKSVTSLRELNKLVKGDERKTVIDAYEKKHAELKGG
jgi:hypothetical protein